MLLAFVVALSGCSQIQKQAAFEPIPQPKSLTKRQQRPVEEILRRQDEARLAAAEAEADSVSTEDEAAIQQEIVADAAERARGEYSVPTIAQVSFETDADDEEPSTEGSSDEAPFVDESKFIEPSADESSVKLIASADDFEGVPENAARDSIDFSQANFLRPSAPSTPTQETSAEVASEAPLSPIGDETSSNLLLPLQPMLFNVNTRTRKSTVEGTLRPLNTRPNALESEVAVERPAEPETEAIASTATLSPLRPLGPSSNFRLESTTSEPPVSSTISSRLLEPIGRTMEADTPPPTITNTMVATAEETAVETPEKIADPIVISEEIIVVDPPAPVEVAAADFTSFKPANDFGNAEQFIQEEVIVPAEIIEDAIIVAEDIERELTAIVIPSEEVIEVENNQFKVQAASNTTPISNANVVSEVDHSDRGEPMFTNNEFAAPSTPGGEFVPPMTVVPAEVPAAAPESIIPASDNFGAPANLEAPAETDPAIAHIASLPVNPYEELPSASSSKVPPVGLATLMDLNTVTWKSRLDEAIELAETRLNQINDPSDSSLVNLRLLKVLRKQMEHVEGAPAETLTKNESQYWQHQLEAITSMLVTPEGTNQAITDYHRHQTAHKTLAHLRNAVAELESIASLKVSSGQFCTEITGFGQFRTFDSNTFSAGQKMLIYCEVENYKTVENQSATGNDFRTRLRGSFAIYDTNGKVVQQAEFPTVDDVARKKRRDFYMYMPVTLGDLPGGNYVLHALVEDIYGNKTASLDPPLQFSVQ